MNNKYYLLTYLLNCIPPSIVSFSVTRFCRRVSCPPPRVPRRQAGYVWSLSVRLLLATQLKTLGTKKDGTFWNGVMCDYSNKRLQT